MDIEPPDISNTITNNKNTRRSVRKRGIDQIEPTTTTITTTVTIDNNHSLLKDNSHSEDINNHHSKRTKGNGKLPNKHTVLTPGLPVGFVPSVTTAVASTIPTTTASTAYSSNGTNNTSKPRFDLSTLLQNFGDPTKQNRGNTTVNTGIKSSITGTTVENATNPTTVVSSHRNKRNNRTVNDTVPNHSVSGTKGGSHVISGVTNLPPATLLSTAAAHPALSQPPFPIPVSLQTLASTDRNVAELLSSMDTVYSENAALREQLRRMDIEMPSTVNHNAARDVERVEQLQRIVSMVHENVPEAQLRRAILGYKDMWADFGKDRWTALRYHLRMLKLLLLPNQITRMCMWSIGGDEGTAASTAPTVGVPSTTVNTPSVPINSTAATITSSLRPAITTWQQISAACEITEEQGSRILSLRDSIRSRRREFAEMLQNLKLLEDRVASNFQGLEFQMNLLMSHLSPRQLALFLDWMERNHVIFNLISSLSAWPQPQTTVQSVSGSVVNHTNAVDANSIHDTTDRNTNTANVTNDNNNNTGTDTNTDSKRNNRKNRTGIQKDHGKGKKELTGALSSMDGCNDTTAKTETVPIPPTHEEEDEEDEGELQGYPFPFTHSSFLSRMLGGNSSSSSSSNE